MAHDVIDVGFDDQDLDSKVPAKAERYKGRKGYTDRIGIIFFKKKEVVAGTPLRDQFSIDECPRFLAKDTHFYQGLGYTFCNTAPGSAPSVCCERLGPSDRRIATLIVKYRTDKNGMPLQPFNTGSLEFMTWAFNAMKFQQLRAVHSENPLQTHDLKITCTNDDFQHLQFFPCKEAMWRLHDDLIRHVLAELAKREQEVMKTLGTQRTDAEILEKLGASVPSSSSSGGGTASAGADSGVDYSDLLGQS